MKIVNNWSTDTLIGFQKKKSATKVPAMLGDHEIAKGGSMGSSLVAVATHLPDATPERKSVL